MTVPHTISCRCPYCITPPREDVAGLVAESYETSTAFVQSMWVEFTGSSWMVYYLVKHKFGKFPTYSGWMYADKWNKMVGRWEESS